ncbi:ferrochelatase [Comamonadaceae bacterium OH2545_COT-014]|nr:ferrochelatase [Comamonadaceae bacterium OH2545_COT-014]
MAFSHPSDAAKSRTTSGTGVLLCNLGSPDAPTPEALRRFLGEFLGDPRVVEIPRIAWLPILHGVVLRVRPAQSAAKYRSIWTPEGSPLAVWTQKQATLLRGNLGERGLRVAVRHAMRYGQLSIASQLDALKAEGCSRILVLPLYPQYSGSTTASVFDAVGRWSAQERHVPALRTVASFHDHAGYIHALARSIARHWQSHGRPDKLVMSFHGVPERMIRLGDPYQAECLETARLLTQRLGLPAEDAVVSFQSRFGRAKWLEPYTEPTLQRLAREGAGRVDVVCPGFVSDCLETLEEIAVEGRNAFLQAGGQAFHYIACLNDAPEWQAALADLVQQQLQGWPVAAHGGPHLAA